MFEYQAPDFKLSPEEAERCAHWTQNLFYTIEKELVGEIEKIEGHVPGKKLIKKFGRMVMHKDGSVDYTWRSMPVVKVKPNQINAEGQRGMLLEIVRHGEAIKDE